MTAEREQREVLTGLTSESRAGRSISGTDLMWFGSAISLDKSGGLVYATGTSARTSEEIERLLT